MVFCRSSQKAPTREQKEANVISSLFDSSQKPDLPRPPSAGTIHHQRAVWGDRSVKVDASSMNPLLDNELIVDAKILACVTKDRETENTKRTLMALERTRIKFPGKTDRDADVLMERVRKY